MKLLYFGAFHGTLEFETLSLFEDMGIEYFCTGLYLDPQKPNEESAKRAPLKTVVDPKLLAEFKKLNPNYRIYHSIHVSKEFVDNFDVVLIDHCCPAPQWLWENWEAVKHKPVIWRTYTQQNRQVEQAASHFRKQGLKIVRLSPKDRTIPNYAGDDAIIRSWMDIEAYKDWTGSANDVVTFNNFFSKRRNESNTDIYMRIRSKFGNKFHLFGGYNEDCPINEGYLSWDEQRQKYREAGVYFALGSKPASLTYNFMEALLTGTPVVTWGRKLGNHTGIPDFSDTYEVPDLFESGKHCFYSDDERELTLFIDLLLNNSKIAKEISDNARKKAIEIWDKKKVMQDWANFFKDFCGF